jgi:hypothetical protein
LAARSSANLRRRIDTQSHQIDADRVAKLVRLLASDKDGEVLAAIAALKRALDIAGMDLHNLADALVAGLKKPKRQQPVKWAPPAPDTSSWESMAWWSHYHRQHLTTSDRDYVHDVLMGHHFDCGRADDAMGRRAQDRGRARRGLVVTYGRHRTRDRAQ